MDLRLSGPNMVYAIAWLQNWCTGVLSRRGSSPSFKEKHIDLSIKHVWPHDPLCSGMFP